MANLPKTADVLSRNTDFAGLTRYFLSNSPDKYIEAREKQLWQEFGNKPGQVQARLSMLEQKVNQARTRWACISAKSQRNEKNRFKEGRCYTVKTYSQLTEIAHKWERPGPTAPPPSRKGQVIHKFSKRSRQRLMSRARKLNKNYMRESDGNPGGGRERVEKDLPIPWFVTLTYRENMRDPELAKEHLNAFLQRWRRRGKEFAYFWKMEPQKRGAVHFHLAMFLPENWQEKASYIDFDLGLKDPDQFDQDHKLLMKVISTDWAEVTKKIDGYYSKHTEITYRSTVTGRVTPGGRKPGASWKIDWTHLKYGTQVRKCENWKMFLAYCYKYMGETVDGQPFGRPVLGDKIQTRNASTGWNRPPFKQGSYALQRARNKTGRFWGFSYNLDFDALQTGIVGHENLKQMNRFCNALNALTFASLTRHLTENAKRAKKQYSGDALKNKLTRYRNTYEAQKRRFEINKDKINQGKFLQFEIDAEKALYVRGFLREYGIENLCREVDKELENVTGSKSWTLPDPREPELITDRTPDGDQDPGGDQYNIFDKVDNAL